MLLTVRWAHLIYVANLAIDTSVPIRELTTRSSIVSSIIAHTPSHACMSRDPPIQGCTYVIVCDATLRAKVVYATDALRLIRLYIRDHHGSTTSSGVNLSRFVAPWWFVASAFSHTAWVNSLDPAAVLCRMQLHLSWLRGQRVSPPRRDHSSAGQRTETIR